MAADQRSTALNLMATPGPRASGRARPRPRRPRLVPSGAQAGLRAPPGGAGGAEQWLSSLVFLKEIDDDDNVRE